MKVFGVVITTRRGIIRQWTEMASRDAQMQLRTLLKDAEHPLRQAIVRVARSAATDHLAELSEQRREQFEADPEFQEWARQRREHDLAEAEKAQPAAVLDPLQLRYGILGLVAEHGPMPTATIGDAFAHCTPLEITGALSSLVSDGQLEVRHGVYSASFPGMGFSDQEEKARDEGSDSQ